MEQWDMRIIGPHKLSLSEEHEEGIRELERLREQSQSEESKAALNELIQEMRDNPIIIDISARERNLFYNRRKY